ncbi:M48 family metallopeptidase [Bacillus carboniphilus]|uniref:M48 family metallopeptidase n=1 Tax=Bacillus carboniphilus TaxID=86663 RepID=A0ABY9JU17_9BACI|nr:M48 family metallopeptidase [Bacillus carboniphilus]WLR42894.1 M48 family metallopeptidase [Bacillus carboniphilus]
MLDKKLIHQKEDAYFILSVIFSVMAYIGIAFTIIGIPILLAVVAILFFMQGVFIGQIRGNGVKLSHKQFPDFYKKLEKLSQDMELKKTPDVYVVESSGMLNAFATRFFGRNMVILYSEIFELLKEGHEEELTFVLAHELAHIKRNHMLKSLLLLPSSFMPFLTEAYSRGCEYTCDRMAAKYIESPNAAANALTVLAIGKDLFTHVDRDDYINQL